MGSPWPGRPWSSIHRPRRWRSITDSPSRAPGTQSRSRSPAPSCLLVGCGRRFDSPGASPGTETHHDGGSIINIGTTASLTASVGELPYACAKAGLNALTVGLAEAFAPAVRVNAILPGPFRTDISRGWAPPEGAEVPFVLLGRMGDPAELAPLALHLASAASSYTTGAIIRVDGGITRKV